jgi:hypothetical protein
LMWLLWFLTKSSRRNFVISCALTIMLLFLARLKWKLLMVVVATITRVNEFNPKRMIYSCLSK